MMEDKRCCGSGTCIINAEGICWCGQRWNGEKMIPANSDNKKTEEADKDQYGIINDIYRSPCYIDYFIYPDMSHCLF